MTKGEQIVKVAFAEVGNIENPKNSNKTKYGEWFGFNGVAWCGIFVSWCYDHAGYPLPKIGFAKGFAGCLTAVAYFKKNNMITNDPKVGDIVFFDWNGDGRYDHTGIFNGWASDDKRFFYTIEGNTSLTNQSNGGEVMSRKRKKVGVLFVSVK